MNLKIRLTLKDLFKVICGGSVMVMDPYNNTIFRVQRGQDTYITKQ
jgi:hypothetical protein